MCDEPPRTTLDGPSPCHVLARWSGTWRPRVNARFPPVVRQRSQTTISAGTIVTTTPNERSRTRPPSSPRTSRTARRTRGSSRVTEPGSTGRTGVLRDRRRRHSFHPLAAGRRPVARPSLSLPRRPRSADRGGSARGSPDPAIGARHTEGRVGTPASVAPAGIRVTTRSGESSTLCIPRRSA